MQGGTNKAYRCRWWFCLPECRRESAGTCSDQSLCCAPHPHMPGRIRHTDWNMLNESCSREYLVSNYRRFLRHPRYLTSSSSAFNHSRLLTFPSTHLLTLPPLISFSHLSPSHPLTFSPSHPPHQPPSHFWPHLCVCVCVWKGRRDVGGERGKGKKGITSRTREHMEMFRTCTCTCTSTYTHVHVYHL